MNFYLAKYASGIFRAPLTGESGNEGGSMRTTEDEISMRSISCRSFPVLDKFRDKSSDATNQTKAKR